MVELIVGFTIIKPRPSNSYDLFDFALKSIKSISINFITQPLIFKVMLFLKQQFIFEHHLVSWYFESILILAILQSDFLIRFRSFVIWLQLESFMAVIDFVTIEWPITLKI